MFRPATCLAVMPALAFVFAISTTSGAMASDVAVTLELGAEAEATLFAMVGNAVVWRSGELSGPTHPVPSEVDGVRVETICVRLGEGWRVPNNKGKTFQASCFRLEQAMIDRGATGYQMLVERGEPSVPMPPGM